MEESLREVGLPLLGRKAEEKQGAEDLAVINDLYAEELEERDAELDAEQGIRLAVGLGTFSHF